MEHFFTLTPEKILNTLEAALDSARTGVRASGRYLTLNSMENRVYEIELDDETRIVAKFYRPGRWTRETILEEHRFIRDLVADEVPAVAPLNLASGSTLAETDDGILFAVFPKVRGRLLQELDDLQLAQVGRFLGRLHNVGSKTKAVHRVALTPQTYGRDALEYLKQSGLIHENFKSRYIDVVEQLLSRIEPILKGATSIRIHGDCHLGNVLWQHDGPFFIDFDDMVSGPPVQDIWLAVRGRDDEAKRQREVLLAGYEQMRAFDRTTLEFVEPLRTLRLVHYAAWIARRWEDPTFKNAFPDFGSMKYWQEEVVDLSEQLQIIG